MNSLETMATCDCDTGASMATEPARDDIPGAGPLDLWPHESECQPSAARLLRPVADGLAAANVRYCVLRSCSRLRRAPGVELDLLVHPSDLRRLRQVFRGLGYVRPPGGDDPRHEFFVQYVATHDTWLKLDVVSNMAFGPRDAAARVPWLTERCLRRRIRCGGWFTPAPDDELMALVLHSTCDKAYIDERHQRRLSQLARIPNAAPIACEPGVLDIRSARLCEALREWRDLIAREAWDDLLRSCRAAVRRLCPAPNRARMTVRRAWRRFSWMTRVVLGLLRPRGISLALLTPGGMAEWGLGEWLCRSMALSVRVVDTPSRKTMWPPSRALAGCWRSLRTRLHQAAGRVVVLDGWSLDVAECSGRSSTLRIEPVRLAAARSASDLVVVPDMSGELLGDQLDSSQRCTACEIMPRVWVVDARRPVREVGRKIVALVWQQYIERGM